MKSDKIYQTLREVFVLLEFGNYDALRPYQLDNIEYSALLVLKLESGWRMVDLRERLLCDKSKLTRIIDRFESRGLARRQPDPGDRRAWQVFLTDEGLQLREQAQAAFQSSIEQRIAAITSAEQEQLLDLLKSIRTQLQPEIKRGKSK